MTCGYLKPKKWSLFDIVGTYSYGTNSALKIGLVPVETTNGLLWYLDQACIKKFKIK